MNSDQPQSRDNIDHMTHRVYENEDGEELVITVDLPGYQKEDISARYHSNCIIFTVGEVLTHEIYLPENALLHEATGKFNNSILTFLVPVK